MILREYQKIAKRWGRKGEKKEMEHGPVENHEKIPFPLFVLGPKSRTGSWEGGEQLWNVVVAKEKKITEI
jgi:hypothetical protein